ncbi:MAG: ABC transporter ATP-binding protein [Candidatus Bipolaricaulota bacterium]|nr:ABC transporter ATP-binding protein [Candidatus Bipolaricaulota bacterium]MDW8126609.1 ABC transporter ATP-binding protein [Candidatus Bipolaricaulota bacterium]
MPEIVLQGVTKRFGAVTAIDNLTARILDREFFVVVGPTACGKTTLLKLLAGLIRPDRGQIYFDGVLVNDIPPRQRGVRMVFQGQDYALYPHLEVYHPERWSNLSFPLRLHGERVGGIHARVQKIVQRLGIHPDWFPRKPQELSEGQKQKVALGRATVLTPKVFLLDEPLSHLDPPARAKAREEIRRLHEELGTTTVYVTHDLAEAFLVGDRVAVMRAGRFLQVATPKEIRDHPADAFVAEFVRAYREGLKRAFET